MPDGIQHTNTQTSLEEVQIRIAMLEMATQQASQAEIAARQAFLEYLVNSLILPAFFKADTPKESRVIELHDKSFHTIKDSDSLVIWLHNKSLHTIVGWHEANDVLEIAEDLWGDSADQFGHELRDFLDPDNHPFGFRVTVRSINYIDWVEFWNTEGIGYLN